MPVWSGPVVSHIMQECLITKFCQSRLEHLHLADDAAASWLKDMAK